jgi:hypothetical protein
MDWNTSSTVMKNLVFSSTSNRVYAKITRSIIMRVSTQKMLWYNSARRKRAFQYAASIREGINYRMPHFARVEDGARALLHLWTIQPELFYGSHVGVHGDVRRHFEGNDQE